MTTLSLPRFRPGAAVALTGIAAYQRWFSKRKGFSCAHRVLHGGPGCSGYAKERIREVGLWKAIPDIRQRFAACGDAADTLHIQRQSSMTPEQRARARASGRRSASGCADGPMECLESLPGASCCMPASRRRSRRRDDAADIGAEGSWCCIENAPLVGRCFGASRGRSAGSAADNSCDCGDLHGCDGCGDCAGGCSPG